MKITVMLGGTSAERDVSIVSGLRVAGALPQSLRPAFLPLATLPATVARLAPGAWVVPAVEPSLLRRHALILRRALRGWPHL